MYSVKLYCNQKRNNLLSAAGEMREETTSATRSSVGETWLSHNSHDIFVRMKLANSLNVSE